MQINNSFVSENTIISMTSTSKKASPVRTENAFSQSIQSPLDYYNTLCKDYPDVTFRLDDIRTGQEKGWGLGYNNSLNQRGTDFGMAGRCSINIDIAVIERMQKDPKYEQQIKGIIASSRKNYSSYEQSAASDGMPYI